MQELHEGNLFFEHRYPSMNLEWALKSLDSFEQFEKFFTDDLMNEDLLMGRYLDYLLEKYDETANHVAEMIGKSDGYLRKIRNGRELNPARDALLAICVYLGTTVDEAQIFLRYSGKQPLYARRKRDAIIWFALKKKQSLSDLDIYLYDHGYTPLVRTIVKGEKKK